jgi:hypothetical protein
MGTTPPKGPADHLVLGDWNATCYICGRKFKASQLRKHWRGYWVCEVDWEPRHPQDFVRAVPDVQTVPWAQDPADVLLPQCTLLGQCDISDYAVSDCAVSELVIPSAIP